MHSFRKYAGIVEDATAKNMIICLIAIADSFCRTKTSMEARDKVVPLFSTCISFIYFFVEYKHTHKQLSIPIVSRIASHTSGCSIKKDAIRHNSFAFFAHVFYVLVAFFSSALHFMQRLIRVIAINIASERIFWSRCNWCMSCVIRLWNSLWSAAEMEIRRDTQKTQSNRANNRMDGIQVHFLSQRLHIIIQTTKFLAFKSSFGWHAFRWLFIMNNFACHFLPYIIASTHGIYDSWYTFMTFSKW